jgi:hypothetical protein
VTAPALAFVVVYDRVPATKPDGDPAYKRYLELAYEKDFPGQNIALFRRDMAHGRVIALHDTDHVFVFNDPKQSESAAREIRKFLLDE